MTVTRSTVTVDADTAAAWLDDAPNKSPLSLWRVLVLANDMVDGCWRDGGQMIFVNGRLTKGRHRCGALVQANYLVRGSVAIEVTRLDLGSVVECTPPPQIDTRLADTLDLCATLDNPDVSMATRGDGQRAHRHRVAHSRR